MKTLSVLTIFTLLVTLNVGLADAKQGRIDCDPQPGIGTPLDSRDQILWMQVGCFDEAMDSSRDTDGLVFNSLCADDFYSATDYALTRIEWWGATYIPHDIESFIITFYRNNGCDGPVETEIVSQQVTETFNQQTVMDPYYHYHTNLQPVLMDADTNYWISIQAVLPLAGFDYWYWVVSDQQYVWGCDAMIKSEYWGYPDWTVIVDIGYELAAGLSFVLRSNLGLAVERSTWSEVRTLFR